mgnify:CR=1 FL=1
MKAFWNWFNAKLLQPLKPYLSLVLAGLCLIFLGLTLHQHWQQVATIDLGERAGINLGLALGITLLAHLWAGWVWGRVLWLLNCPVPSAWAVRTYLITNIAKYLPGNVFHFYGRVLQAQTLGVPVAAATLSVILEPVLMAVAALSLGLLYTANTGVTIAGLSVMLIGLHPRVLNPLLGYLLQRKLRSSQAEGSNPPLQLKHYPTQPLLGELLFLGLRCLGFLFTVNAVTALEWRGIAHLVGAFSLSWLLGLITPGAPGGLGVFEVSLITLLDRSLLPGLNPGRVIAAVALYRLISTVAEAIAAFAARVKPPGQSRSG